MRTTLVLLAAMTLFVTGAMKSTTLPRRLRSLEGHEESMSIHGSKAEKVYALGSKATKILKTKASKVMSFSGQYMHSMPDAKAEKHDMSMIKMADSMDSMHKRSKTEKIGNSMNINGKSGKSTNFPKASKVFSVSDAKAGKQAKFVDSLSVDVKAAKIHSYSMPKSEKHSLMVL